MEIFLEPDRNFDYTLHAASLECTLYMHSNIATIFNQKGST